MPIPNEFLNLPMPRKEKDTDGKMFYSEKTRLHLFNGKHTIKFTKTTTISLVPRSLFLYFMTAFLL